MEAENLIREWTRYAGLTPEQGATRLGVTPRRMRNLLNGAPLNETELRTFSLLTARPLTQLREHDRQNRARRDKEWANVLPIHDDITDFAARVDRFENAGLEPDDVRDALRNFGSPILDRDWDKRASTHTTDPLPDWVEKWGGDEGIALLTTEALRMVRLFSEERTRHLSQVRAHYLSRLVEHGAESKSALAHKFGISRTALDKHLRGPK